MQVLDTHNLSMFNTRSPSCCDSLDVLASLLALSCENVFKDVQNDFVGAIPDAVDILLYKCQVFGYLSAKRYH